MPVVHQRQTSLISGRQGQRKLRRSRRIRLHADTKYLRLYTGFYFCPVVRLGKYLLDRFLVTHPGAQTIRRHILETVTRPDVHNTGNTCLFCKMLRNSDTRFAVFDPEPAHLRIRTGKCQSVLHHRMREKSRIKIQPHSFFLRKRNPSLKMLRLQSVTVCMFPFRKNRITRMYIDLLFTGDQGNGLIHIRHQFFRRPRLARIISRSLNTAGQRTVMVKACYIVTLPAVHGDRHPFQSLQRSIRIHPDYRKDFFCRDVSFCCCHVLALLFFYYGFFFYGSFSFTVNAVKYFASAGMTVTAVYLFLSPYTWISKDSATHFLAAASPASSPALIICAMILPMAVASPGPA